MDPTSQEYKQKKLENNCKYFLHVTKIEEAVCF